MIDTFDKIEYFFMDLVGEKGYFIFGKNPLFRPLCSARHAAAHSVVSDGGGRRLKQPP